MNRAQDPASADRLLHAHRTLKELLDQICDAPDAKSLAPLLHQLRFELSEHFQQEEGPHGFGAAVSEAAPHRTELIQRLFEEHTEFLNTLSGLEERAGRPAASEDEALCRAARELCHKIRKHEAQENDLLTETINTDLGGRG